MILVAVGALVALIHFIANVVNARLTGQIATLPLFSFALLAAAIIGIWTLLSGAAAFVPLWLWSLDVVSVVDPGVYRLLFWGFGHGAQQVNLAVMIGIWYALATITTGARPLNEGLSRFAFVLYILFINTSTSCLSTWARSITSWSTPDSAVGCVGSIPATSSMPPSSAA
jgi:cytochrome c oxidase subunit 1